MNDLAAPNDNVLLTKLWTVCESLLHDEQYKETYASWLTDVLLEYGDRDQKIIDTAAGVGFPALQLFQNGFQNLFCSDADPDLLRQLLDSDDEFAKKATVVCSRWQDLPVIALNQYDTVLCLDASIAFMDSWGDSAMVSSPENICERVKEVLHNFYALTKPGGQFFVGLQKNNNRGNTEQYIKDLGDSMLDGHKAAAIWDMRYDWDSRKKTWVNKVKYRGECYEQIRHSYLFDKHDLKQFLVDIGFASATEVSTPDMFYEDVIVATKAGY